jgi:hypothetical protein
VAPIGAQNITSAGARPGTIPVREGTSRDTADYRRQLPSPCNAGAAHQPPPKTRTPAALALTCCTREYYQPAGPLEGGPWRVPGGERGQPWACTAPGSHPTATASARAPALGGHGGCGPSRRQTQNQIKCTGRGLTRAGRAVPRYYRVLRPPSQPLQPRSAPRGPSALGVRAGPRGARECRQRPQGGRGGTWGWPSGQGSTGKMCPPLDEL